MQAYQRSFHKVITGTGTFSAAGNGAFLFNCVTHCAEQSYSGFNTFKVPRMTATTDVGDMMRTVMQVALTDWWESDPLTPATEHTYVEPCALKGSSPCNPTCSLLKTDDDTSELRITLTDSRLKHHGAMQLTKLTKYSGVRCLDGSPGSYYFEPGCSSNMFLISMLVLSERCTVDARRLGVVSEFDKP